jgi:hypothetical protein
LKFFLILFSYIFHPLFISIYAVLGYFYFGEIDTIKAPFYSLLVQVVIITFLLPLTFYMLLRSLGKVSSVMLKETSQRKIPLFLNILLLFILIKKSNSINYYPELYYFFLGGMMSSALALLFVFYSKKASLHMVGMMGLLFFTIGLSLHFQIRLVAPILFIVICSGWVATSRLEMKAHSINELFMGILIGAVPQLGLFYFWL